MRRRIAFTLSVLVAMIGIALPQAAADAAADAPFKLPYPAGHAYTITQTPGSGYSHDDDYNRHAVDFAMPTGTPIVASAAGRVHLAGWTGGGGGIMVLIDHGGNVCTQYAHLNGVNIQTGQNVAQGQHVAASGNTGNSTGPHLHWNVVQCSSHLSLTIPDTVERGTSYPTGLAPVSQNTPGPSAPAPAPVYETASRNDWRPLPVGHDGRPLLASSISSVVRSDGTKIIYSVRGGQVYETASSTGWRSLAVPGHSGVTAVSAIAHGTGVLVYTIRNGAVYEAHSNNWNSYLVGHNGQPLYADALDAVVRADGTRILYTIRGGQVYETASSTGWRSLAVPGHSGVTAVSTIAHGTGVLVYTIRNGAVYEAHSNNWNSYLVGHNGQPLYADALDTVARPDGTRLIYTVRAGRVFEAASNVGWRNLQVPNLAGVTTVSAIHPNGTILYTS